MVSARFEEDELRRRAIEGVEAEIECFGAGRPDSRIWRRGGVIASVVPATPDRSLFNSVTYAIGAGDELAAAIDELASIYAAAAVRAWTVFVPEADRAVAELLATRGHLLDAAPRAMALDLAELGAEPAAPGVEARIDEQTAGAMINDRAYGYDGGAFSEALAGPGTGSSLRWLTAHEDGEALASVGTIDRGDDCCVTCVATAPEHRGRGLASWLMHRALADAKARGAATASLQSTAAGRAIYARLGFHDLGPIEMWERRVPAPGN